MQQAVVDCGDGALQEAQPAAFQHDDADGTTPIETIVSFGSSPEAQEAVVDSFYHVRAHVAPYGEVGKRVKQASDYLKSRWKYIANERTLTRWVQSMISDHEKGENDRDKETGKEYDRDVVEVCY